jgi:hypothetical protein
MKSYSHSISKQNTMRTAKKSSKNVTRKTKQETKEESKGSQSRSELKSRPSKTIHRNSNEITLDSKEFDIVLRDDQPRHVERMMAILRRHGFVLDNSALGSGKTFSAMAVFKLFNLRHMIYVGTLSLMGTIKDDFEKYNIPTNNLITFQGLRSTKGNQPKHGLLTRHGDNSKDGKVYFKPTDELLRMIREGVLFIADEIQYVRNDDSLQCVAVAEIEKAIIDSKGISKVMELSGLPGGKERYYLNLMTRFRIIKDYRLSVTHKDSVEPKLLGAKELVDFCMDLDPVATKKVLIDRPFRFKNIAEVCFELYYRVVQHHITDAMPPPESVAIGDCKNGYYNLNPSDTAHLNRAINNLDRASGFNSATNSIDPKKTSWSFVTKSLRHIEIAKINIFISVAVRDLEANPKAKVCIGLNYSTSIKYIAAALEKYGVRILWGKIPGNKRQPIIDKFNEPNTDCRVLVANIKVINCGIRLDDRHGDFPRSVYGSASYFFIECHQLPGRFNRGRETLSDVKFRFVYGHISTLERSILRALSSHTKVCIKTSQKQVENGVKFPGEFEDEIDRSENICHNYYNIGEIIKSTPNLDFGDELPEVANQINEPPTPYWLHEEKESSGLSSVSDDEVGNDGGNLAPFLLNPISSLEGPPPPPPPELKIRPSPTFQKRGFSRGFSRR